MGLSLSKKKHSSSDDNNTDNTDNVDNETDNSGHHKKKFRYGWSMHSFFMVIHVIAVVGIAVYFSWQWNSRESTGARVLYALGAWTAAPFYLIYSFLARRDGISIQNPSTLTKIKSQSSQSIQRAEQQRQKIKDQFETTETESEAETEIEEVDGTTETEVETETEPEPETEEESEAGGTETETEGETKK